jgi:uncharacterized membrane protein
MFFFGWLVFNQLHRPDLADRERSSSKRSWLLAVVYGLALAGGDVSFILATHRIPAAQANLISFLWPVMIVAFGAVIGLFRLRLRQIVGLVLGFSGAVILIWDGRISMSVSGIGLALLSGACWAAYCAELTSLTEQTNDRANYLRLTETLTAFMTRMRSSAQTLDIAERQRIVRLLIKEVLVGDDTITIRHSIPIPTAPSGNDMPPTSGRPPATNDRSYLLCKGSNFPDPE